MGSFYPIKTIEDREQMLKSVLALQTQIRAKRKKNRLVNNSRHEKYAKIFKPITRTLKNLSDIPSTTTSSVTNGGSGFLFSIKPPPFTNKVFKPSTVVIPSDNKGLMRELLKALMELRAGNTSMRNLVVPLAQEARRKGILPPHLLSVDEEIWVFA